MLSVIISSLSSCTKDIFESRSGELCFTVKADKLMVSNETSKEMHFDAIDSSILPFVSRIPFDCSHFQVLKPGESVNFQLDSLLKNGRNPLSITWWQCKDDKVVNSHQTNLVTSKESQICTKAE